MNAAVENADLEMPAPLNFTDNAAAKVKALIDEEGNPELKLRVFVQGGGCSGFQTALLLMRPSTKTTPAWRKMA